MSIQTTITPHNQQPFVTRSYPSEPELNVIIESSAAAQKAWRMVSLQERIQIATRLTVREARFSVSGLPDPSVQDEFRNMSDDIAMELTLQMGR
jgi:hypothetical protein